MEITLRHENASDHIAISDLVMAAFRDVPYSDHLEQVLIDRLRRSDAFILPLSIVAEDRHGVMAGHILLTKITIQNKDQSYPGLILAPLSVRPAFQNMGVGARLTEESHRVAQNLGYPFIVVYGHANYYPKFGYELLSKYHIQSPVKITDENSMIIFLADYDFPKITGGMVQFSDAFFE